MDTEDGQLFLKNLAYYVRTHEKALADAQQVRMQKPLVLTSTASTNGHPTSSATNATPQRPDLTSTSSFTSALSLASLGFGSQLPKAAKLCLTPNQLYYLLSRFEELGVSAGPMNVRLESIHSDHTPSNYVSFLAQAQRPKGRTSDQDSIHSVSSVRSVMSSVSSVWSSLSLTNTAAKVEKRKAAELEDLRYLYSAFTKIPCLRLAHDHRIPRINGYEEFPFDTAVPVYAFKNLSTLEVVDLDFRSIFGWDRLADQLRTLTLKRACIEDLADLLVNIVLDDADRRRRRSAKTSSSPISAFPPQNSQSKPWGLSSTPDSPGAEERREIGERPLSADMSLTGYSSGRPPLGARVSSISPPRPSSSRRGSTFAPNGRPMGKIRQSSGSSSSSMPSNTPRTSSTNLSLLDRPMSKWRQLKHLSLADNGITSIARHSLQPLASTLHSLDLSANLFTEIPDSLASLVALRALNLSNCMIESLHSLARYPLPAITVLNLRANRIASLAGIEKLLSLERLDLRENKLTDPTELARLTGMPNFQDIFVGRNPFVKTHSSYRITIFNLFRQAPGYVDDITIDSFAPGYNERRYLVERAPELVGGPVIPISHNVEEPEPADDKPVSPADEQEDRPERRRSSSRDPSSRETRRKKGARRRIVDIASSENARSHCDSNSLDAPYSSALKPPPTPLRDANGRKSNLTSSALSPIPSSPNGDLEGGAMSLISDADRPELALGSEQYRKKIEALKKEFGSGWLSALGDDKWDQSATLSPVAIAEYTEKDVPSATTAPSPESRPVSDTAPVVASTRRIG